jgi:hypothetical protein
VLSYEQGSLNEVRDEESAPIAVLFSGGLDSMILAALLDQCIDSKCKFNCYLVFLDNEICGFLHICVRIDFYEFLILMSVKLIKISNRDN